MTALSVTGAATLRSPQGPGPGDDTLELRYFRHLLQPYGQKPDEELFRQGSHLQHRDMVNLLAADDAIRESRPQLLIVTHALPDVVPFTAVASHFTALLGGAATCFAINQQGLAAPFTALRIAAAYQRSGRADEVVIAVLEQTTLPTSFPLVQETPLVDSAVALVLRAGDGGLPLARVTSGASATAALAGEIDGPDTVVVLGPWVDDDTAIPDGPVVHRVGQGSYCTSVWLELADNWRQWRGEGRKIVLCDTDPRTARSHVAVFDRPAAG